MNKMPLNKMSKPKAGKSGLTVAKMLAMTDAQRDAIAAGIDAQTHQQRTARAKPLTAEQRRRWNAARKQMGRPRFGQHGTRIVSITVEKDLLAQADRYAKAHGLKRSELFVQSLSRTLAEAG